MKIHIKIIYFLLLHHPNNLTIQPFHIVTNRKASEKHYRRTEQFAPKTGTGRLLRLIETQYQNTYMVSGETYYQEKTIGSNCHIML